MLFLNYEDIKAIVDFLDFNLSNGARIMLHSQGRADRLALILACWLVKHKLADENNFIDKIAELRFGLWADGEPDYQEYPYHNIKLNEQLYWIADETRPHIPQAISRKTKIRKMMTVPFLFSKELINEIKYWEYGRLPVDYETDDDILNLIKKFESELPPLKKAVQEQDTLQITIDTDGEVYLDKDALSC